MPTPKTNTHGICIFCTLQLQARTTATRTLPQRRLFQSGRRVCRPPATAAAQIEEEYPLAPTGELSQLSRQEAIPTTRKSIPASPQPQPRILRHPLKRDKDFASNYASDGWNCLSCGYRNGGALATCEMCNMRIAWDLQKKQSPASEKSQAVAQAEYHYAKLQSLKVEQERMEQSQQARLEQTKDGRYVSLRPHSLNSESSCSQISVKKTLVRRRTINWLPKPVIKPKVSESEGSQEQHPAKNVSIKYFMKHQHRDESATPKSKPEVFGSKGSQEQHINKDLINNFFIKHLYLDESATPKPKSEVFDSKGSQEQHPARNLSNKKKFQPLHRDGSAIPKSKPKSSKSNPKASKSKRPKQLNPTKNSENTSELEKPLSENSDGITAPFSGGWKKWTPEPQEHSSKPPEVPSITSSALFQAEASNEPKTPREIQTSSVADSRNLKSEESNENQKTPPSIYNVKHDHHTATLSSVPKKAAPKRNQRKSMSFYDYDDQEDDRIAKKIERKLERRKEKARQRLTASPVPIHLPEYISVSNLAGVLKVRVEEFESQMRSLGFEETNNDHILDAETAALIATEFNFDPIVNNGESKDLLARPPAKDKSHLPARPPVVTIMGHVDHGKTTLLDWLRKSSVAASEHGGITQHIGAFSVAMPGGRLITFLDTPGHAAFLSMRQRGANVTDIVILVVAADDSVKPQTIEAIKHSQAAKVPIIVAINKVDKDETNIERVKQDLSRYGVEIEEYGGDTQVVCVSGKTGQGMQELEETTIALADVLDMRAENDGMVEGWVLEASKKKAGFVATVLVRRGTVRPGDVVVAGSTWAKVRSLRNEAGVSVIEAGPGTPVEMDGWRKLPTAGDEVLQADDERRAKSVVENRVQALERSQMAADMTAVNESRRLEQEKREEEANQDTKDNKSTFNIPDSQPGIKQVFFIIKADVSGSVEAIVESVSSLGNSEVRPHILRSGVGPIIEFDVDHAASAQGHIITFNSPIDPHIVRMAETAGVEILNQNIIYRLIDDVKSKLSDQLGQNTTHKVVGEAEIAQIFDINIKGRTMVPIAGCKVRNGILTKSKKVKVLRNKETIYDGSLNSLKNMKKDVVEMRKGTECGVGFDGGWADFKIGDLVQSYDEIIEKRTL